MKAVLPLILSLTLSPLPADPEQPAPIIALEPGDSQERIVDKAANVVPSPKQLAWQQQKVIAPSPTANGVRAPRTRRPSTRSSSTSRSECGPTRTPARSW